MNGVNLFWDRKNEWIVNRIFERVIITIAVLLVLASAGGLYITATSSFDSSSSSLGREVVGKISSVENNVKRKVFGNFAWDIMDSGEPVFFKDVIFVSPKSTMKLVLADQTELVVGENTLLVLDNKTIGGSDGKFEVTELRLIRGQVSVNQPASAASSKQIQVVLNNNVKFDLKKNAKMSLSKLNGKASVIFDKGNVAMAGKKLNYVKPTLINEIDLNAGKVPDLSTLATQDILSSNPGLGDLPVVKLEDSVTAQGDLSGLDGQIKERKFANQSQRKIEEKLTDPEIFSAVEAASPRDVAAIEPQPEVPKIPTELPEKELKEELPLPVVQLPTPEPKKARMPITLVTPEDRQLVDMSRDIKQLSFNWESTVANVHFYMLEISADKKFSSVLTRIAVEGSEGRSARTEDGRVTSFELKVSPVYMLYVPGLLGSVYKSKELYWRVVPLDSENNPIIRSSQLDSRKVAFKVSKSAEIFTREVNYYSKETAFSQDPIISFNWSLKNVVPGSYQLIVAEDPEFKRQICTKDVSKYNFKKGVSLKAQPDMAGKSTRVELSFEEDIKVNARTECPLEPLLKSQKSFYYKIISFDPADQRVPYNTGKGASGKYDYK
jgi:hypothetical protein